jgi:hypothetical protein
MHGSAQATWELVGLGALCGGCAILTERTENGIGVIADRDVFTSGRARNAL